MKLRIVLIIFSFVSISRISAQVTQTFGKQEKTQAVGIKYLEQDIIDVVYGIDLFDKLCQHFGGDSVRHNEKGYACQGWVEDFYKNGKQLHKGYYVDGQLRVYKNYYDNGQLEREYKVSSLTKSYLIKYYKNGIVKSSVEYYKNNPLTWEDFHANGKTAYKEVYDKKGEVLLEMKSYKKDGSPESIFEVTNEKKQLYTKKEYHENGTLKEEGPMKYSAVEWDYVKEGKWLVYNESGTLTAEQYFVEGKLNKTIDK